MSDPLGLDLHHLEGGVRGLRHAGLDEIAQASTIKTLSLLEAHDRLCMCGIAILMNRTLSAMTSIVDRLVGKGLIARQSDTNDRRRVICAICSPSPSRAVQRARLCASTCTASQAPFGMLTNQGDLAMLQLWRIDKERLQLVAH